MTDLSDADPVAVVVAWLKGHSEVTALLGDADHISGIVEAPWPHVTIYDGFNGDLRGMVWSAELEVELEVVGAPDGTPGQAELWRIAMKVLKALTDMPEQATHTTLDPVVSDVQPSGVFAWTPMANGQPRYVVGVRVTIRPPLVGTY